MARPSGSAVELGDVPSLPVPGCRMRGREFSAACRMFLYRRACQPPQRVCRIARRTPALERSSAAGILGIYSSTAFVNPDWSLRRTVRVALAGVLQLGRRAVGQGHRGAKPQRGLATEPYRCCGDPAADAPGAGPTPDLAAQGMRLIGGPAKGGPRPLDLV